MRPSWRSVGVLGEGYVVMYGLISGSGVFDIEWVLRYQLLAWFGIFRETVLKGSESIGERYLWIQSWVNYMLGIPKLGHWVFTILCLLAVASAFGTEHEDDTKSSSGSAPASGGASGASHGEDAAGLDPTWIRPGDPALRPSSRNKANSCGTSWGPTPPKKDLGDEARGVSGGGHPAGRGGQRRCPEADAPVSRASSAP